MSRANGQSPIGHLESALRERGMRAGSSSTWQCPSHEDRTPSLSVRAAPDGTALIKCHAGCSSDDVLRALGLEWAELFAGDAPNGALHPPRLIKIYWYTGDEGQKLYGNARYQRNHDSWPRLDDDQSDGPDRSGRRSRAE